MRLLWSALNSSAAEYLNVVLSCWRNAMTPLWRISQENFSRLPLCYGFILIEKSRASFKENLSLHILHILGEKFLNDVFFRIFRKKFRIYPSKFLMTFLVIDHKWCYFPIIFTPYPSTNFFSRFTPYFLLFMSVNTTYAIYFFLFHHCRNSFSSLHIFVHHCTFCA